MILVGQRLQQERIKKGFSVEDVARATKIRQKFISALEKGDYKKLPSSAYIQGFIKNYAEFLGLPKKETLALFRREFDEREFLEVLPESFSNPNKATLSGFRLNTATFYIIAVLIFVFAFIFFEYRSALFNPKLSVSSPLENSSIESQSVLVVGSTDPDSSVTINDQPALIDKNGNFKKAIQVFTGSTSITVKAVNKFGRKTLITKHIVVK